MKKNKQEEEDGRRIRRKKIDDRGINFSINAVAFTLNLLQRTFAHFGKKVTRSGQLAKVRRSVYLQVKRSSK